MRKKQLYLIAFCFQVITHGTIYAAGNIEGIQVPPQCQGKPLFEVEKKSTPFSGSNVEVRFCHGMVLKSRFNKDEIESEGATFSVTYADGSTEEICGILVANVKSKQIHIYHPATSKLPQGALQPNGYNPSWFDQFLQAYGGRGYLRTMHPSWDEGFSRNIFEYTAKGFVPTAGPYLEARGLSNGQVAALVDFGEGAKFLDPKMSGTYEFTPFLSLQEVYTGQRSHGLEKNSALCGFSYYNFTRISEKPLANNLINKSVYRASIVLECERRKKGSYKTDEKEAQIFQNAYLREFGSECN